MRLLALIVALSGCTVEAPCSPGTALLHIDYHGVALNADRVRVTVDNLGSERMADFAVPASGSGTVEIQFPQGYPEGSVVLITLTAFAGSSAIAYTSSATTLQSSCSAISMVIGDGPQPDLGGDFGPLDDLSQPADLSSADFAGVDLASADLFGMDIAQPGDLAITGLLVGSIAPVSGNVNLTSEGTVDWAHWGLTGTASFDRKISGNMQIGNYTELGKSQLSRLAMLDVSATWQDGTPTTNVNNTATGTDFQSVTSNAGFMLSVAADTSTRVLRVYFEGTADLKFTAHLSDSSAPDYNLQQNFTGAPANVLNIQYRARSAGQTLSLSVVMLGAGQDVALMFATLH